MTTLAARRTARRPAACFDLTTLAARTLAAGLDFDTPPADPTARAVALLRRLRAAGRAGADAAFCLTSARTAVVADWRAGRVYEVELDVFTDSGEVADTAGNRLWVRAEWGRVRAGWAAGGHLADPELAAALKAFQTFAAEQLRLHPSRFRVGGKRVG